MSQMKKSNIKVPSHYHDNRLLTAKDKIVQRYKPLYYGQMQRKHSHKQQRLTSHQLPYSRCPVGQSYLEKKYKMKKLNIFFKK